MMLICVGTQRFESFYSILREAAFAFAIGCHVEEWLCFFYPVAPESIGEREECCSEKVQHEENLVRAV